MRKAKNLYSWLFIVKSFQLAPNPLWLAGLITIHLHFEFPRKTASLLGKLRKKITSPIVKSTSPELSGMIFFLSMYAAIIIIYKS